MSILPIAALGEVADLRAGVGFPTSLQGRTIGDYPFAKVGDISRTSRAGKKRIVVADNYVDKGDLAVLKAKLVPRGSVLFAKIGEAIRQNHRVVADQEMLIDNNAMAAVPNGSIDSEYLYRFLQTVDLYKFASSTTVPSLRKSELEKIRVPLPPLAEQRRIAAILDHADALRAKRREALACLDELTQSIFIDMFGDPATNSKGLEFVTIGDLLDSAQYGTSEKSGADGEFAVLRMNNITYQGQMDLTDLKYTDLPDDKVDRFTVRAGDVLFNRTNSAELVGKTAVYRGESPMAYAGYLVRLRVADGNSPEYISAFLNSRYGKAVLRGMCKSIVGMANINAREVQSIRIPRALASAQKQFEQRVALVESSKAGHHTALAALDALFASLQSRAFQGEL
ncbi:restriction endonuclease subunit S [Rhodococcus sp. NPDC004095]